MVGGGAETDCEGGSGGGDAKGYLFKLHQHTCSLCTPYRPGMQDKRTKSASESSSCPIKLLFLRHLATFPSKKSKNRPNGMNASAAHRLPSSPGAPAMYRMEEKMDMTPQRPLSSVIRSARCSARMRLKWPVSSLRRVVCLSTTTGVEG